MAKRRANGEGNIRKRKDSRWEGRYTAGRDPVTGKVIYKNVLGRTQAEVKAKLKAAIEANMNLDIVKAEQYTVGQWMDVWFENCAKIKVRPSSHQTYRGYIDNHIKPNIGKILLRKLSSLDFHGILPNGHTAIGVLRLERSLHHLAIDPGDLAVYLDRTPLQVDILPFEAQQLAPAQPCGQLIDGENHRQGDRLVDTPHRFGTQPLRLILGLDPLRHLTTFL